MHQNSFCTHFSPQFNLYGRRTTFSDTHLHFPHFPCTHGLFLPVWFTHQHTRGLCALPRTQDMLVLCIRGHPPLFQSFVPSHMPHGSGAIPTCTATRAARPDRAGRICSLLSPQLGATAADSATASASGGHFEPGGTSAQPAARGAWPTRPRAARVGASVGASRVGARRGWAEG